MAVNKNFVIKNGIQVNENLLYGDPDQTRVSIGTYVPLHTLHVIGGIGGTHAHITGISTFDRNLYVGGGLEVVGVTSLASAGGMTTTGGSVRIGRGLFVADGAQITGVTTINNNIDANRNLDVFVQTTTKDLLVTGVGTINGIGSFGSNVDIAGDLTVNGILLNGGSSIGTDVSTRNLIVSGLSTFTGLSTFQNGIFVSGVGTFANDLDINGSVDVDGHLEVDNLSASGVSTFVGLSTFQNGIYVTGVSTFVNDLDINANVDIFGTTELDRLNVSGMSTLAAVDINGGEVGVSTITSQFLSVTGISTFNSDVDINANVDIAGSLAVTGLSTFSGDVIFAGASYNAVWNTSDNELEFKDNAKASFGDGTDLLIYHDGNDSYINERGTGNLILQGSVVRVGGSGTTETMIMATQDGSVGLYFDDSLELETTGYGVTVFGTLQSQQLNVTGVSTFSGDINIGTGATVGFGTTAYFKDNAKAIFGDGEDLKIHHGDGSSGEGSYIDESGTGKLYIRSNELNIKGVTTNESIAVFTENGAVELYYDDSRKFATSGLGVTVFGDLDVTGISTFSNLTTFESGAIFTGVTTFSNNIDANGDLDVDGHTELDDLNVSGVSTFASNLDINADVDIDGHTELDYVNVSAASTFGKVVDINSGLDVTGVSTFSSNLDINANVDISGDVNITGITTVHDLVITGVTTYQDAIVGAAATFTSIGIKTATVGDNELKVVGETELDGSLNVTGLATFSSPITATSGDFSGIVTATQFVGFGSQIDGIVAIGTRPYDVGTGIGTAPGKLWWNAETGIGYVYYHDPSGDEFWVDLSGQAGGPTSGSINDLVRDTSPQLGGNLDLNGSDITGTGNINITGNVNFTGSISGTGITAAQVTVDANPGTANTHQLLIAQGATSDGDYDVKSDDDLFFTPSTNTLSVTNISAASSVTATTLHGDGSNITGLATTESVNARFLNAGITTISQLRTTGVSTFMGPVGIGTFDEEIIDTNNEFTLTTKGKLRVVGTNPYQPDSLTVISFGTAAYNQTYVRNGNVRGQTDEATNTFNVDGSLYPWSTYYYDAGGGNYYVIGRDDTVWKIFTTTVNPTTFVNGTTLSMTSVGALATASITKDGFESPDVADPNVTYGGSTPVGIGTTISLDGNTGIVSATAFYGDGSNLTGIAVTDNVSTNSLVVSGVSTLGLVTSNSTYITGISTIDASAGYPYKGLDVLTDRGNINIGINTDEKRIAFTGTGNTTVVAQIVDNGFGTLVLDRPTSGFVRISIKNNNHLFAAEDSFTSIYHAGEEKLTTTSSGVVVTGLATANNFVAISSITATSFYGDGANLTGIANTGDINADRITVVGVVTAATFIGDGSGLSNLTGIGTGVFIQDDDADVGAATTINFGKYISVSPIEAGITTITGIGTEHVTSDTLVAGISTITTLEVGVANTIYASNGIVTATSFYGDGSNLTGIGKTDYIRAQTLTVAGVSTLGVVTATAYYGNGRFLTGISTESVNAQFLNSGITTVRELNIQGSQVFDYSTLTLSGFVPSSFDGEYTRQTTGFTLDTGSVSSGNALFHADSNYYYYSKVGAASTAIVFSNEDNSGNGQWIVFYKDGSDFTEGNITNNDALGTVDASSGVALTSIQYDNNRESIPGASDVVYNSSYNIGISTLGIATANQLYVSGITTIANSALHIGQQDNSSDASSSMILGGNDEEQGINFTGTNSSDTNSTYYKNIRAKRVGAGFRYDLEFHSNGYSSGDIGDFIFYKRGTSFQRTERMRLTGEDGNLNVVGIVTAAQLQTTGLTTTKDVFATGIITATSFSGDGSNLTGIAATANINANTLVVTGVSTVGVVTSGTYYGDGSNLADGRWTLGASGSDHYTFTGIGFTQTTADPVFFLARGRVYEFVNPMGAHPFRIQSTANGSTGTQYDDGVTNNNVESGTLRFEVPFNAPNTLYYQCTSHAGMGGTITIYPAV